MTNDDQHVSRGGLGRVESDFLAQAGLLPSFSVADACRILGPKRASWVRQLLDRLRTKGWIERIKAGRYAVIPLSSGSRSPQIHEFLVAMELVKPAAIAYFSAMNHHGFTEQLPRTVFVATDHRVSRADRHALGYTFKIVSLRKPRFFGVQRAWINERSFMITDREKTIVDALDLPQYAGGIGSVHAALQKSWNEFDESRLREYASRIGNTAIARTSGRARGTSTTCGSFSATRANRFRGRNCAGCSSGSARQEASLQTGVVSRARTCGRGIARRGETRSCPG